MNDILKICDFVTTQSEEFLLELGCRIRTTNKPLPWRDERRILIPYGNKITLVLQAILHDKMDLNTVARLVGPGRYWADPRTRAQVVYQALYHMLGKTVAKDLDTKKYMWRGSRPKYKIKALEIPADIAMKFLVLGGLS
jgi:hypothetical protein